MIAIGAVLVVAGIFTFWKLHNKAVQPGAKYAPANLPNSLAALNASYVEPPEGQNAALFYLKGLDSIQISQADFDSRDLPVLGHGAMPALGESLSPPSKASIASLVQRNESAFIALQQGAAFEQARYPIDLTQGGDTLLPHLGKIKKAVQLNQLRTALFADDKQPQDAADSLLLSLALGQSLKDEPTLISQLVRVACNAIVMSSLDYTINLVTIPSPDLERLSTTFAQAESQESAGGSFSCALMAERAMALAFFDLPPDKLEKELNNFGGNNSNMPRNVPPSELLRDLKSQRAFADETFKHALAMRQALFPERLKVDEYMASRAKEASGKKYYISQLLLGALGKATRREAAGLANLRLAQTGIALERFRQANGGQYPDSLAKLTPTLLPEVPVDPFDGKPLHYDRSGEGYELGCTGIAPAKPLSFKVVRPPKL
jgi:hypothetical protein